MSEQREPCYDPRVGLGRVRWGDDAAKVREQYADRPLGEARRREGVDPLTGARLVAGAGVTVPDMVPLEVEGLQSFGTARFDDGGALYELSLSVEGAPADAQEALRRLAQRLGLGELDPAQEEVTLDLGEVQGELFVEHDGWQLTFRRGPGPS